MSRGERVRYTTEREREREREREKEKETLRFWNDLSPLSLFSCFCSFLLLWFFGLSSKMKQKAEGEQTNSRLDRNIK
jgi:photosystem I subunit PsaN